MQIGWMESGGSEGVGGAGGVRKTSVKGSASMCVISRGHWFKDVFP